MKFPRSKRGLLFTSAALLLVLFLVRPGATHLKTRIANSIGLALQRQVEIGKVRLRLLPQPGFDLASFIVHDDPSFGSEPVLRADEVSAFLRVSSLLRGHLEISRLSLSEPSLNLVRNGEGHWNLENLLERSAKTPVAPTSKAASESRPAFPYIEADHGRINFKSGPEKKAFTLTEAEYALWQESENTWGMRLRARPVRTDINLSDTGRFSVSGTWQRAPSLRETPVQFNLLWDGGQLGQVTKLFSGRDKGWRGGLTLSATLTGTPADLTIGADGSLDDFRRYDIAGGGLLGVTGHCDAHYSSVDHGFHQILCRSPLGDGRVTVRGELTHLTGSRAYDVSIAVQKVPAQSVLVILRHAKKDLPDDLFARGIVNGDFIARSSGAWPGSAELDGSGEATNVRLESDSTKTELALNTVPFSLASDVPKPSRKGHTHRHTSVPGEPEQPRLIFGPFGVRLGRPSPATVRAWVSRSGYDLSVTGEAEVAQLLQIARTVGVPTPNPTAEGWAKVDLHVAGPWAGFAGPRALGTAQLHSLNVELRGLNGAVEITSATLTLAPDETRVESLVSSLGDISFTGSVSAPRPCSTVDCPLSFNLRADEIVLSRLHEVLNPVPRRRPWYRLLSPTSQDGPSVLTRIRATGTLTANQVSIRDLECSRVSANLELNRGQLRLSDLRGEVLGGKHRGEWRIDFGTKAPTYSGSGTLENISLEQLADLMHDDWVSGTASGKYKIEMSGPPAQLFSSASGELEFVMRNGSLPHVSLVSGPLRVRRFSGTLHVNEGEFEVSNATLDSPAATFDVSGKASLGRKLDVKLTQSGSPGFSINGTLSAPRVTSTKHSETRAALKP